MSLTSREGVSLYYSLFAERPKAVIQRESMPPQPCHAVKVASKLTKHMNENLECKVSARLQIFPSMLFVDSLKYIPPCYVSTFATHTSLIMPNLTTFHLPQVASHTANCTSSGWFQVGGGKLLTVSNFMKSDRVTEQATCPPSVH